MPKKKSKDTQIKSVLKYSASYPYFGKFKFSDLYSAQRSLRKCEYYDTPIDTHPVYIGKIDGDVICGALWRLMEYNPGRFGTVSPFLDNGHNNIFQFIRKYAISIGPASGVISQIRKKLMEFLSLNARKNGQWSDEIITDSRGCVNTILRGGRTGSMYKRLCLLRDAVKIITTQNESDFKDKKGPYRDQIIDAVRARHPELFPNITPAKPAVKPTVPSEPEYDSTSDRIDDISDSLQITLDNRAYISSELYQQALADRASLMHDAYDDNQR